MEPPDQGRGIRTTTVGIDLNYEGITTSSHFSLRLVERFHVGIDLNYEGITTHLILPAKVSPRLRVGIDLNYEGITTTGESTTLHRLI